MTEDDFVCSVCGCPRVCHAQDCGGNSPVEALAALRKIRDTLRRPDLGPGTTLRIISETVDKALPQEKTT